MTINSTHDFQFSISLPAMMDSFMSTWNRLKSIKKMPPNYLAVGNPIRYFLKEGFMEESLFIVGGAVPGLVDHQESSLSKP